ncbi:MAG: hypothetical protein IKQ94_00045 [Bacteroidales bacterium]|nr:hypothetical protein [Bacteroidales bacterium]
MKRLLSILLLWISTPLLLSAQHFSNEQIKSFIDESFVWYPKSTLQDLYKSFYQSVYGPEHLVTDSLSVLAYIDKELEMEQYDEAPGVEYLGISKEFVRVPLHNDGPVPKELIASCFIRSSRYKSDVSIADFREQWREVVRYITENGIQLNNFSQDSLYIENLLSKGKYVWVHSPQYKAAYKPHYRVVSKEIFEKEIQPLLMKSSRLYIVPDNRPPVKKKE